MKVTLFIVTKADAILALIDLQKQYIANGIKIINHDTYSFTAKEGDIITKVFWDGGFIEAELNID